MNNPQVVSADEWHTARAELLVKEKEATRARDALAAERRRLPIVRIEKDYAFEGPDGELSLEVLDEAFASTGAAVTGRRTFSRPRAPRRRRARVRGPGPA